MNFRKVLFLYLLFFNTVLFAQQAPGYLGKRFSLDYGSSFFPALGANEGSDESALTINKRNSFGFNYVRTRDNSLGVHIEMVKTQFLFNRELYSNGVYYYPKTDARGDISAVFISLESKKYLNKHIAPVGSYFSYKLFYTRYSLTYDNNNIFEGHYSYEDNAETKLVLGNYGPFGAMGGAIAFGKQHLFFQRLLFNYEMQVGLLLPKIKWTSDIYNEKPADYVQTLASKRLMMHNLFNFKVGLGYLIF